MTIIKAEELADRPGIVREAMLRGDELTVTFHGKPMAIVSPHDQRQKEREDLKEVESLRAENERLRSELRAYLEAMPAA